MIVKVHEQAIERKRDLCSVECDTTKVAFFRESVGDCYLVWHYCVTSGMGQDLQ
jgi:hypothetical protein